MDQQTNDLMTDTVRENGLVDDQHTESTPAPTRRPRSRWWWLLAAGVVAVAAVAAVVLLTGDDTDAPIGDIDTLAFDEVVRTDLVQMDSFDGVLGTEDGDPITSPATGTVTATAAVGSTVDEGDAFLAVDNQPVVLFLGDLPAYRELAPTVDSMSLIGQRSGVITDVVEPGDTIEQGDVLYRVDGEPVVVLYGDTPAYRTLFDAADNLEGHDVLQLETALVALGYDPDGLASVDEEFTDYTETMVERWQEDLGVEADGRVEFGDVIFIPAAADVRSVTADVGQAANPGHPVGTITSGDPLEGDDVAQLEASLTALGYDGVDVDGRWDDGTKAAVLAWQADNGLDTDGVIDLGEIVFLPAPVRVNEVLAAVGSAVNPGSPVLAISSADQTVTFDLPAVDQGLVDVGQTVTIEMPDGTETPGTVVSVASVATAQPGADASFEVQVTLDDPSVAAGLDEAPVDVEVVSDSVEDVMAVPVSALVALAEGGYAVEVDAGNGTTRLVAVDPGFFADGLVEVTSDALTVGDRVVVP